MGSLWAGLSRSGFTMTILPLRTAMLSVQPTLQELQAVDTQASLRAIHLLGFSSSVAVGQTSMQAPQKSHADSWTAPPAPKAMRLPGSEATGSLL